MSGRKKNAGSFDRALARRIEILSQGVPEEAQRAMQMQAVAWSIPEWMKLGPSWPQCKTKLLLPRPGSTPIGSTPV